MSLPSVGRSVGQSVNDKTPRLVTIFTSLRDFQFRIAEEEAIKSDEDLSIRGRRQARKNKLILNMIKETNAYLLSETVRKEVR